MDSSTKVIYLIICLGITVLCSCAEETTFSEGDLIGSWEVIAAKRNGRLTGTLKDGYFKFSDNNMMETNILGELQSFEYSFSGSTITQKGEKSTNYKIRMLQNDTLHLSSELLNYNFDFLAVRSDGLE